jgi:hypothetical protein
MGLPALGTRVVIARESMSAGSFGTQRQFFRRSQRALAAQDVCWQTRGMNLSPMTTAEVEDLMRLAAFADI